MKVSIIIPCYNQERYIAETLDCLISQSYQEWECIIIDDGSTDRSKAIILTYVQRDSRLSYIYQENAGVCHARNNAAKYAKGEYLLFVDSDDLISKDFVGLCVDVLDASNSVKLVACNYKKFGIYNKKFILEPYSIEKLMGHNLWINACMIRRNDFERVGGYNSNMKNGLEDWDLWLSILEDGGDVRYLDGFHYFYRIRGGSRNVSTNDDERLRQLRHQMWVNHHKLYTKVYSSAFYSEEYRKVALSYEYKIGKMIFKPVRAILKILGL